MKIYPFESIIKISHEGLTYVDERQNVGVIAFSECRKQWVEHIRRTLRREMKLEETRCVGERNSDATPPYIEFFCEKEEHIRFTFPKKAKGVLKLINSTKDFERIHQEIIRAGHTTFDLS